MSDPLPADKRRCPTCGAIVDRGAVICMSCRADLAPAPILVAPVAAPLVHGRRSRNTAAILALLLGGIGAHKFYLGQTTNAILYLVFSFTAVPAILGLVDGILMLRMSHDRFAQRFG